MQAVLAAPGVKGNKVTTLKTGSPEGITDLIKSIISADPDVKEPFYVLDLGAVVDLFQKWMNQLEIVRPFYAVKSNPDPALLGTLASLGAGFDCASRAEIESILALGVTPDRILYANPCKPESHIKFAAAAGVNLTTFDSVYELDKIRRHHPNCSLLLRLKAPDDTGSRRSLGSKYGALPEEIGLLLRTAWSMNLPVIGVSFHVGSAATIFETYNSAIGSARAAFDLAERLGGLRMHVLNIGGGFTVGPQFENAANVIKSSINAHFADRADLRVVAEPGRFFSETVFTLATCIIGKRVRGEMREYWINDGLYGSMSCIRMDTVTVTVTPLVGGSDLTTFSSMVFGQTCDSLDIVMTGLQLPELEVGDWLVSPNMGAYTTSIGSNFNGFATSAIRIHLAHS